MRTSEPALISSTANPIYKRLSALHHARDTRARAECLAGGERLTVELLHERPADVAGWVSTPGMPAPPATIPQAVWVRLSPARFNEINVCGVPGPLLVMRTPCVPAFVPDAPWPPGCSLFLPFGDPENVGAAIRAAAGLGASRVILTREAACPFLPKAIRSAAGATWKIPLLSGPPLAAVACPEVPFFALALDGDPLPAVPRPPVYGLIAGQEGPGLPGSLLRRGRRITIPLAHGVESLNAAAAVAVALWAWRPGAP